MTGSWQQASQLVPESPGSLMLPAALSDKEKPCPSPKALSHTSPDQLWAQNPRQWGLACGRKDLPALP